MKKLIDKNTRLIQRANWLMIHRWYAITCVIIIALFSEYLLDIDINSIYIVLATLLLVIENIIGKFYLKKVIPASEKEKQFRRIKRNINYQISFDLFVLIILIHYLGGIESPFKYAFFFHMVVASILLSRKETLIQTTLAVFLLTILTVLEYHEILPHNCFCLQSNHEDLTYLYKDIYFIYKTLGAFIITLYILIYISTSIGVRLRDQEDHYEEAILNLNRKDKLKDQYVLRLTHDIKGHITAIQSSLSVVKNEIFAKLDKKNEEFVSRAYKRTYALIKFIKDLLRLTKMRLSDDFEFEQFSLKNAMLHAFNDAVPNADLKSIEMHIQIDETVDDYKGDQISIQEITTNMILNAVKYTPVKGNIKLSVKDKLDHYRIEISDTGLGVPKEDQERIYEEFYRGSNVDKKKIEGTGVGLAIARNVVVNHGGKIWVESELGKGSVFIYTLPKDN